MQDHLMEEVQTWSAQACLPVGRSGHRIACNDSFLYCVGGYNPSCGALQEAWRLNLSTCEWEQLSDETSTPVASVSHCLASYGQDLLLLGGTNFPFGSVLSCEVEACDTKTGEWRTLQTTGVTPPKLYGQAARRLGEFVYTVGGTSGFSFSLHAHALHLPTLTWTCISANDLCKEDESVGRYRAEIGVVPGRLVVLGGGDAYTIFPLDEVPVLSIETGEWNVRKTKPDPLVLAYPSPRRCHAAVQRNNELYVIGGTDGEEVLDDVWKLDLLTLSWTRLSLVLPTPLYFHDAALTQSGYLYVYGGLTSLGSSERSSAVYRGRLDAPPLLEAAWDAFTTHCPSISTPLPPSLLSPSNMPTNRDFIAAGIPRAFIKRLTRIPKERVSQ
ncbi:kelch domain-containing protein 10-like [Panulirus ornatus]|uniref:kelch domain-containing protein 10-like n=1 Tax=Panulirus ornatus TaxID=150431 RepID=UPI003A8C2DA0